MAQQWPIVDGPAMSSVLYGLVAKKETPVEFVVHREGRPNISLVPDKVGRKRGGFGFTFHIWGHSPDWEGRVFYEIEYHPETRQGLLSLV